MVDVIGDLHLGFVPVGEVIDGNPYNLLRDLQRLIFVELDTIRTGDMGLGRGGDNLGVVVLCNLHKALHYALDINDHCVNDTRSYSQLLLEEVAHYIDSLAHQYLVGGAADTRKVYPLGPLGFGILYHLRVLCGDHYEFGECRLMTMHNHIHLILPQYAEVAPGSHRPGGAEEDIADIGGEH